MVSTFHTLVYPVGPGAPRDDLAFPAMVPGDRRTYRVDMADFCASAGAAITGVSVVADATLAVTAPIAASASFLLTVYGGDALVPWPSILFVVTLDNGDDEKFTVAQQVGTLVLPAGTLPSGAQITAAFHPVDVSTLLALVGGAQSGDEMLVLRGDTLGLLPVGQGGGAGPTDYPFVQATPATTWTITHNLGRHPSVTIVTTSGDQVDAAAHYVSANQVVLSFAAAFAGTAYLN